MKGRLLKPPSSSQESKWRTRPRSSSSSRMWWSRTRRTIAAVALRRERRAPTLRRPVRLCSHQGRAGRRRPAAPQAAAAPWCKAQAAWDASNPLSMASAGAAAKRAEHPLRRSSPPPTSCRTLRRWDRHVGPIPQAAKHRTAPKLRPSSGATVDEYAQHRPAPSLRRTASPLGPLYADGAVVGGDGGSPPTRRRDARRRRRPRRGGGGGGDGGGVGVPVGFGSSAPARSDRKALSGRAAKAVGKRYERRPS